MSNTNKQRYCNNRALSWQLLGLMLGGSSAFAPQSQLPTTLHQTHAHATSSTSTQLYHWANRLDTRFVNSDDDYDELMTTPVVPTKLEPLPDQFTRRSLLSIATASTTFATILSLPLIANASEFAPGGTLLDREVSIFYGNSEASPSRKPDNSNVIFNQDNYYKFGAAAQWIEPGSTEFPKKMPFVLSQQRYDNLKKYGARITSSMEQIVTIGSASSLSDVPEQIDPVYQIRAMGLLANNFFASENTGTTNELMLARWYINEMYLRIGDYRVALEKGDASGAKVAYGCLIKACNSYLTLLNRSITSKVGDPFSYL